MNLDQLLGQLRQNPKFMSCVTHWRTLPAAEGKYADFPESMDPRIQDVLRKRGIYRLYTHQAQSFELAQEKKDFVVVTPTASGKTLCYNLPVLSAILKNEDARALYLFPTKALSADQVSGLYDMIRPSIWYQGLHLRRRHPERCPEIHPAGGAYRGHQPGYAPCQHSAPSHQMGQAF